LKLRVASLRNPKDGEAWLAVFLILVSVAFGGQSRDNPVSLAVIGVVAAPLLAWSLWALVDSGEWRRRKLALAFLALVFVSPLLQLVPIPADVYSAAPGRGPAAAALALVGVEPRWMALSMNPDATRRAAQALMAPAAMFLLTLRLRSSQQVRLSGIYLACGGLSLLLGIAQLASRGTQLYVSPEDIAGSVVGFFANRNHFATFLLCLTPLAAIVFADLRRRRGGRFPAEAALGGFSLVVLLALALARSRFGLLAAVPTLGVSILLLSMSQARVERRRGAVLGVVGAAVLALGVVAGFGLQPILNRFTQEDAGDRPTMWARTLVAAGPFAPLGAGPGAFDRVYRAIEPASEVKSTYVNQAHNDYLEGWLESGVLWLVTVVAGATIYVAWTWRAWRSRVVEAALPARAASFGLALIAVHSIVDYPMRTEAIAVLAAFLLGVLGAPTPQGERPDRR
jgi:O-antigen ligase